MEFVDKLAANGVLGLLLSLSVYANITQYRNGNKLYERMIEISVSTLKQSEVLGETVNTIKELLKTSGKIV